MARKTSTKPATKAAKNPTQKRAIDDNYVAPKKKPEPKPITLAEALAEAGQTMDELKPSAVEAAPKPERPVGTSNLASTIRSHRSRYTVALHPNGKKTQNNGDYVAQALLSVPFDELVALSATRFGKSFAHLNPGHARMCIGNLIRGAYRKAEDADLMKWVNDRLPKEGEE